MISQQYEPDYSLPFQPTLQYTDDIYKVKFSQQNSIKILYLNARSIGNKIEDLQHILENTSNNNNNTTIHLIAVTEHWINSYDAHNFVFENYHTIVSARDQKKGGGSAIFVAKNQMKHEIILQYSDDENSITSLKLFTDKSHLVLTCIYRPPNTKAEKVERFFTTLMNHLDNIERENSYCIGDFNIDTLSNDNLTHKYLSTMQSYGFYICDKTTVTRPISNTCIDHLHTNQLQQKICLQYASYDQLDHTMIFVELNNNTHRETKQQQEQRIVSTSRNLVSRDIQENSNKRHSTYEKYIQNLNTIINQNTKYKQNNKNKSNNKKPWIDSELQSIIKHKNFWYTKFKKDQNNISIKEELKYWRNKVTYLRRKKRNLYFESNFTKNLHNSKGTWKCITEVIYNGRKPTEPPPLLSNTNNQAEKKDILNKLNIYLSGIGKKITGTFEPCVIFNQPQRLDQPLIFNKTTKNEVNLIIENLKDTNATGFDKILTSIIKENKHFLVNDIVSIINSSLMSGKVPETMKISRIAPIHKGGDTQDFNNYRPISILPNMDKIMTKIVNNQLVKYIEKHNIINKQHYGFRLKSNTSTALFDVISAIQQYRDNKEICVAVFIDLQKAFDSVKRSTLLKKLWCTGIRGKEYDWFSSYMSNRKQYIEMNGITTDLQVTEEGIPQGGNLASTLFLLYINDITECGLIGTPFLYADDIVILYHNKGIENIQSQVNSDMIVLHRWMSQNYLKLNTNKTKYMIFSNKTNINFDLTYNSESISQTTTFKYLGVTIDNKLNWNSQINITAKKTSAIAGLFRKIRKVTPHTLYKSILNSLFISQLTYGIIVWGSAAKTKLKKLQTIQNRAIKNLYKYKRDENTKLIHQKHNIMTVLDTIQHYQSIHIHNILHLNIHTNTKLSINNSIHNHETRTRMKIHQQNTKSERMGINSTKYTAIRTYNNLPETYKSLTSNAFKYCLKTHIKNNSSVLLR